MTGAYVDVHDGVDGLEGVVPLGDDKDGQEGPDVLGAQVLSMPQQMAQKETSHADAVLAPLVQVHRLSQVRWTIDGPQKDVHALAARFELVREAVGRIELVVALELDLLVEHLVFDLTKRARQKKREWKEKLRRRRRGESRTYVCRRSTR